MHSGCLGLLRIALEHVLRLFSHLLCPQDQPIVLSHGALLIDMPGMRELGMLGAGGGIEETYADIVALAGQCRFPDCTHGGEPGCAVRAAVARNDIGEKHLQNYLKLCKESAFHDLSLTERRNKDKAFGRFIHAYKKRKGGPDGE